MNYYIIDGNNLIGKINKLWHLQKVDGQKAREQLVFMLERYFAGKKVKVSLHFDGFPKDVIKTSKLKIIYSENKTADDRIKNEIDIANNPKLITVVSSDLSVFNYAKANSCKRIKSEQFAKQLSGKKSGNDEDDIIKSIDNDEMKKLFGIE